MCFEINLSQETINDREVLKRINDKILEYWIDKEPYLNRHQFQRSIYKPWLFLINFISTRTRKRASPYHSIINRLETLQRRLAGAVSTTQELGTDPNLATTFVKGMSEITIPVGKVSDRSTVNYSIATAKEAEDELIAIFDEIRNFEPFKQLGERFVFIIDELDKIEPQSSSILDDREFSNPALDANINIPGSREYRKRQEAVAKLLANLKGFLNSVKAKFFFIGGRELFDADLADIADRDTFYGSIFNDVIYVESFYRDIPSGKIRGRITSLNEEYLLQLILGQKGGSLDKLFSKIKNENGIIFIDNEDQAKILSSEDEFKLISLLQNYIIYLTYRSTGSPKKLTSLIERLIVSIDSSSYKNLQDESLVLYQEKFDANVTPSEDRLFLKFSYNTQYEINLTTDILRPYLINNSRFLTELGDKLLFSTPFILTTSLNSILTGFHGGI